jgi:hypothetical protein
MILGESQVMRFFGSGSFENVDASMGRCRQTAQISAACVVDSRLAVDGTAVAIARTADVGGKGVSLLAIGASQEAS